jgi:hypothetical protein
MKDNRAESLYSAKVTFALEECEEREGIGIVHDVGPCLP